MSLSIEALRYYPLTGGPAIELEEASVIPGGFQADREYLLYDPEDNNRIGSSKASALVSLVVDVNYFGETFVQLPNDEKHQLPFANRSFPKVDVNEWGDQTDCYDLGDEMANVFSKFLEREVRLAQKTQEWMLGEGVPPLERANAPLHIVTSPTVEWIRDTFAPDSDFRRYRPNIVLTGDFEPEEEQDWVGKVLLFDDHTEFAITRGTGRCGVPWHDPETGEPRKDVLKSYKHVRRIVRDGKKVPAIGIYGVPIKENGHRIRKDSKVELLDSQPM